MAYHLWNVLDELKSDTYEWVDLTHPLNNDSPYWAGIPEGSVELSKTCFDWGNPMLDCLIQTFKFPGQFGTHIDFPGHFVRNRPLAESYGAQHMLYPLCVIDVTAQVAKDVHYAVTVEDIKAYEEKYGAIPDGAFVALYTGWSKHWPDMDAISGIAEDGSENFPGWSMDALKYIYETRNAAASGHETLDTDASVEAAKAGDLACERYILDKGKLQVEVLTNLDRVAPAGALLFVAWPNIEGATGLPARVIAITPKK
jgi:cyclase family protein